MNSLIVHRASRTERLADELIDSLHRDRPDNPLTSQAIVIPHAGMRRWLLQTIAQKKVAGRHGIAANFDTMLPWQWLQRTACNVLGDEALATGDYSGENLRWHIYSVLPHIDSAEIDRYVGGSENERHRFQLAAHLADVFTQYLVYRPEMILAWERGAGTKDWQADLWRAVRARIDAPHRAERNEALVAALAGKGDGEALPLHIFGVSHLPPDVLACVRAVAAHRSVHVYFPDPCREHWDYLRKKRSVLATDDAESLYFEVGHPLLASLGRIGQDFSLALDDAGEHRDALDEEDAPDSASNLLDAVQIGIRHLQADYLRDAVKPSTRDASLRIHACHTRLRELEVLKDQLLGFLADDESLQARDIVVMAPDIAAYAPHLSAVFGEPARYSADRAQIPWHLADVALARTHPLFTGFAKLLDLGESRFRLSDVLDLLDIPPIARRFGLDDDAQSRLEPWLRQARVAWGLDASMKEHAGAAPVDANTWSFGFDRLYAGMIVGNEDSAQSIDSMLPVAGVSGNDIDAIGRLDRFIETLRRMRSGFAIERPLAAWSNWLLEMLDALFAIDVRDDKEDDAMDALRHALASLAEQANAVGAQNLPWHVVRDAVRSGLETVSDRQPFLLGGVTFCGLVPQRSIPFRVVCLLGMNEGEYPRIANDGGLNRMQSQPRRGDRDTRNEDRYLFLEAVMAARAHLHISYIGEDVGDGSTRNPASPLAELLEFLDEQFDVTDARKDTPRPWIVHHPLQPFDARYYTPGGDERLFSFDRAYAVKPELLVEKNPFIGIGTDDDDGQSSIFDADVSLKSLKTFWRDPAKASLRDAFGISLDALGDDAPTDSEPLSASVEKRERLESQLLSEAMRTGATRLASEAPAWLADSGVLPAGDIGARAYARVRERAQAMLDAVRGFLGPDFQPADQPIDLQLDPSLRIVGVIDRVFRMADGSLRLLHAKPGGIADFRDLLPFYIDYALLRLTSRAPIVANFFDYHETAAQRVQTPELCRSIVAQTDAQLTNGLHELAAMMRHAARTPPFLFPKTTWAWLKASAERRDIEARGAWEGSGSFRKGERDFEPGYAALVARDTDFLKRATPGYEEFEATNAWIGDILDPSRDVLLRAGRNGA